MMTIKWDQLIVRDETDRGTLDDTIRKCYHVPNMPLKRPQLILDLGCHAGYTLLHLANMYPTARLHGFDLSPVNVGVARQNVKLAGLEHRITVDCAAVADASGRCNPTPGYSNQHMIHRDAQGMVPIITLDEAIDAVLDGDPDFVKFDIEGAERGVFQSGDWHNKVKHLKAELHYDYTVEAAMRDLQAKGYVVVVDGTHPACVEAWK